MRLTLEQRRAVTAKQAARYRAQQGRKGRTQVLNEVLPGSLVADLVPILGSMFFIVGDIDK